MKAKVLWAAGAFVAGLLLGLLWNPWVLTSAGAGRYLRHNRITGAASYSAGNRWVPIVEPDPQGRIDVRPVYWAPPAATPTPSKPPPSIPPGFELESPPTR